VLKTSLWAPAVADAPLATPLLTITAKGLVLCCAASKAQAQSTEGNNVTLPPVSVQGQAGQTGYKVDEPSLSKYTEPLRDTPQTINVVPKRVIEQRGATSLREVLRNVPGITVNAGEGGGPQGDNLRIRGFAANTDLFLDGMRDISQTSRDPFNLQQLEVLKGPSSIAFGRGSTGGIVNQVSKTPDVAAPFYDGALTVGTDMTKRATIDLNQPLTDGISLGGAALRLNAMVHDSDVAGRDEIENSRWGFAPSLTVGQQTDTRATLSYYHLTQDNLPDYGLPLSNARVPSGIDQGNYYGLKNIETEQTQNEIGTLKIEHDINDMFMLRNQFRYEYDTRYAIVSPPRVNAFLLANGLVSHNVNNVTTLAAANAGNAPGRDTYNKNIVNQTDLTSRFSTLGLDHAVVTGIELSHEVFDNRAFSYTNIPAASAFFPNPRAANGTFTPGTKSHAEADTFGVYAIDTVKLGKQWEVVGGLRYDRMETDSTSTTAAGVRTDLSRTDDMPSWRGAVVYKPVEAGSIYVAYGTSFNPSAESLSLAVDAGGANTSANSATLPPEKNKSYEIGTKWEVLEKKLFLTGAIFRIVKSNARTQDPLDLNDFTVLDGEQRVNGFEVGMVGQITKDWQIMAGYTYLDGKVTKSKNPVEVGAQTANTPHHSFSAWTTYDLTQRWQVGFGTQYISERTFSTTNTAELPSYWLFDAMVGYRLAQNVDLRLNILNLTDEFYIDKVHSGGGHGVPGAGRTALLTTAFHF
jgi:catecholate siderophore receptor